MSGKQYCTFFQSWDQRILIFSESYWQTILHLFPELTSNNTDIFTELLASNAAIISRFHVIIKQYWHFQRVPGKQNYVFFQSLYQAMLTFSDNFFQFLLKTIFRVYIAKHWNFHKVTTKQYQLIPNTYQTVFTLSQSCYQTKVNTFWESQCIFEWIENFQKKVRKGNIYTW